MFVMLSLLNSADLNFRPGFYQFSIRLAFKGHIMTQAVSTGNELAAMLELFSAWGKECWYPSN